MKMLHDADAMSLPRTMPEPEGDPVLYATDLIEILAGPDGKTRKKDILARLEELHESLTALLRSGVARAQYREASVLLIAMRAAREFLDSYRPIVRQDRLNF